MKRCFQDQSFYTIMKLCDVSHTSVLNKISSNSVVSSCVNYPPEYYSAHPDCRAAVQELHAEI